MTIAVEVLPRRQTDRIFFTGMAFLCLLTVFAGFARTYFFRSAPFVPLTPLYHLHALLFTAWILFFIGQTALVAGGRTDIHRRMGYAGAVLASGLLIVGVWVGLETFRGGFGVTLINELRSRGGTVPVVREFDANLFLAIPIGDIGVFAICVAAAILLRGRPDAHKRLMLLATISLLTAAIARLRLGRVGAYVGTDIFVAMLLVYDFVSRGRVHAASFWGGALIVVFKPWLYYVATGTAVWLAFADALR